jgi:hypothetical protein
MTPPSDNPELQEVEVEHFIWKVTLPSKWHRDSNASAGGDITVKAISTHRPHVEELAKARVPFEGFDLDKMKAEIDDHIKMTGSNWESQGGRVGSDKSSKEGLSYF